MNWSHALLVVFGFSLASFWVILHTGAEVSQKGDDANSFAKWAMIFFAITVISGALAAGLWR